MPVLIRPKKLPKPANTRGFVMYAGPSVLDRQPIVVIATMKSSNDKTGDMVQVWILRSDIDPVAASKIGADISICGNCLHRHFNKGACYVNLGQAPLAVYKSYKAGKYPAFDPQLHSRYFTGRKIRLGAYGDPAAAPYEIMQSLTELGSEHTGYTHQIAGKQFDPRFLSLCMVSADSPKQAKKYQSLGAKTFRIAAEGDKLTNNELQCPNQSTGIQCIDCLLCDGSKRNIVAVVHGSRAGNFRTAIQA
jgi:hypothetical protein